VEEENCEGKKDCSVLTGKKREGLKNSERVKKPRTLTLRVLNWGGKRLLFDYPGMANLLKTGLGKEFLRVETDTEYSEFDRE